MIIVNDSEFPPIQGPQQINCWLGFDRQAIIREKFDNKHWISLYTMNHEIARQALQWLEERPVDVHIFERSEYGIVFNFLKPNDEMLFKLTFVVMDDYDSIQSLDGLDSDNS